MAYQYLTLLDLAKINADSRVLPLVEEAILGAPELAVLPSMTITGTGFTALVRTALPVTEFRKLNEGVEPTKSTYENRLAGLYYYDGQMEMDVAVALGATRGQAYALSLEEIGHVAAFAKKVGAQLWYGQGAGGDADGFPGAVDVVDSTMVIDAGGTTASTGSSAWLMSLGDDKAQFLFGNQSLPLLGEWRKQTITRASKEMTAWKNSFEGYVGAQLINKYFGARIRDLTADTGKGLTDALMFSAIDAFPTNARPVLGKAAWFMSRRSLSQLRTSRTAGDPDGSPVHAITDWEGIPIYVTDSIINTEALS